MSKVVMSSDLISVIVPIYNVKRYLAKCIESILSQTYKNLEIICVNDGSTDGSTEIAKSYATTYDRIQLVSHDHNMGLGPARNTGLKYASGSLVGFVDSDDYLHPTMYEKLYELMSKHDVDMAQCSAVFIKEDGTVLNQRPNASGFCNCRPIGSLFNAKSDCQFSGAAWNKLYKKKLFVDYGIKYPSYYFEDIPVMVNLLYYANSIASREEGLYFYTQREDSIVNNASYNHLTKLIDGLLMSKTSVLNFLENHGSLFSDVIMNYKDQLYYRRELIIDIILSDQKISLPEKKRLFTILLSGWCGKDHEFPLNDLGSIFLKLNQKSFQIDELKSIILIELHQHDMMGESSHKVLAFLYFRIANCYVRLKKYESALGAFSLVLNYDPKRIEVHLNRSDTLRYLRRFNEAFAEVDILENKNEIFPGIWKTRAKIWKAMGDEKMMKKCLKKEFPGVDPSTIRLDLPELALAEL